MHWRVAPPVPVARSRSLVGDPGLGAACGVGWARDAVGEVFGGVDIRESIFKNSHSKSGKKFQNLDPGPDFTRECLTHFRRVYVGGKQKPEGA